MSQSFNLGDRVLLDRILSVAQTRVVVLSERGGVPLLAGLSQTVAAIQCAPLAAHEKHLNQKQWDWQASTLKLENALRTELIELRPTLAVITSHMHQGPPTALVTELAEIGVREIWYVRFGEWERISFSSVMGVRLQLFLSWVRAELSHRWFIVRRAIARRIIRYAGRKLPEADGRRYLREQGNAVRVPLPLSHRATADDMTGVRSELMLFENELLLKKRCTHEDIRWLGCGRYQHWEHDLYLSSTDNTDPATNGRNYRYLNFPRTTRILRLLGLRAEMFFHTVSWDENEMAVGDGNEAASIHSSPAEEGGSRSREQAHTTQQLYVIRHKTHEGKVQKFFGARERRLGRQQFQRLVRNRRAKPLILGDPNPRNVALFCASLGAGGAERQICYVALALRRRGFNVTVFLLSHGTPEELHYLPILEKGDVPVVFASNVNPDFNLSEMLHPDSYPALDAFMALREDFIEEVWNAFTHLAMFRPAIVHCWLDKPNIVGGIAGWCVGASKVILSGRNVNPTHFPYIFNEWYRPWYQLLSQSPRVQLSGNSRCGIESYADWLGVPASRFVLVHNGLDVDELGDIGDAALKAFRSENGITPQTPVITGVFRLSPEKRPKVFLEVVDRVRKVVPNVRAFIAGIGPMQSELLDLIAKMKLGDVVTLLGRRTDIPIIFGSASVVVLTSEQEGLPNVLMEAQWFEKPVVSSRVGGVPEVVLEGQTGYVVDPADTDAFVDRVVELLSNENLRRRFGVAAREYIAQEFSIDQMVEKTLDMYGITSPEEFSIPTDRATVSVG